MGFQQFPIAGTSLVRDALNSPNFVHLQSGWSINRDGTAEFNDVVVRGTIIASDFRSSNFVPQTSGFDLNGATGTVEFNGDVAVYGNIFVHASATAPAGTVGAIQFVPDAPTVAYTGPGAIYARTEPTLANADSLVFQSPADGVGNTSFLVLAPALGASRAQAIFGNAGNPLDITDQNTNSVGIVLQKMRAVAGEGGNIAPTTASAAFVALGTAATDVTIPYPPSGVVEVMIGGAISIGNAAQFGIVSFEIRNLNAAGAVLWAASDNFSMFVTGTLGQVASSERTVIATPTAPASGTLFIRPMFRATGGTTLTYQRPYLIAHPVP